MPRYFFDVDDGSTVHRDQDGVELEDDKAAREAAAEAIAGMAKERIAADGTQSHLMMLVRDAEGRQVSDLVIQFAMSPPLRHEGDE